MYQLRNDVIVTSLSSSSSFNFKNDTVHNRSV